VLCVATAGYASWKHQHPAPRRSAVAASSTPGEFVSLPPVESQRPRTVYVVAAQNCPHEAAQRSDRLAEALSKRGIAVERTHQARFRFTSSPDGATIERINAIMNGPLPAVFVDGRAKSNPSVDEVAMAFAQAAR
jgi:hypothetical protein